MPQLRYTTPHGISVTRSAFKVPGPSAHWPFSGVRLLTKTESLEDRNRSPSAVSALEALNGFDEVEMYDLADERDCVAARLTSEAVVDAHLGVHGERRRLLLGDAHRPCAEPRL